METKTKNFLAHHGVLGMKWGVRKENRVTKAKKQRSEDFTTAKKLKKKKPSTLSNSEMEKLLRRVELENRYRKNITGSTTTKITEATKSITAVLGAITAANKVYKIATGSGTQKVLNKAVELAKKAT